jgi:hypothetical protein
VEGRTIIAPAIGEAIFFGGSIGWSEVLLTNGYSEKAQLTKKWLR